MRGCAANGPIDLAQLPAFFARSQRRSSSSTSSSRPTSGVVLARSAANRLSPDGGHYRIAVVGSGVTIW